MDHRWAASVAFLLIVGSVARAGTNLGDTVGVLDQLTVPGAATGAATGDHSARPMLTADPVAVPTPTAAESGLTALCGLGLWRVSRRALRRA